MKWRGVSERYSSVMLNLKNWCFARVWEGGCWGAQALGSAGVADGELGDHVKGRFVATYVLEQKGYSGWCT